MGRIYRIVPKERSGAAPASRPQLGKATASDLVPLLAHRNGWWRLTAQRLMLERQDKKDGRILDGLIFGNDMINRRSSSFGSGVAARPAR
jgi:hypothetical protein